MKRRISIALVFLGLCMALLAQTTDATAYVAVWEPGWPYPRMVQIGEGLVFDRTAGVLRAQLQSPGVLRISDDLFTGEQIRAEPNFGPSAVSIAVPTSNGAVYLVHSQAVFYNRIPMSSFQAGGDGYAVEGERVYVRPYSPVQGVIRAAALRLE
jgi:hypothetical protein